MSRAYCNLKTSIQGGASQTEVRRLLPDFRRCYCPGEDRGFLAVSFVPSMIQLSLLVEDCYDKPGNDSAAVAMFTT